MDKSQQGQPRPSIPYQQLTDQQKQLKYQNEVKTAFLNYSKDMQITYHKLFDQNPPKSNKYFDMMRERKRQSMEKAISANQQFLSKIIEVVEGESEKTKEPFVSYENTLCQNISKIRTTVKQFFREWCAGSPEIKDYAYLVEMAQKYLGKGSRILVPGSGLGRLVLELVHAGFSAQGNEVTYFMLFGSNFILNYAQKKQQFVIYPFIHTTLNHSSEQSMFRSVMVPDIVACQMVQEGADFSMTAGQFTQVYSQPDHKQYFDGIITCFFLDTANNILKYIDTIFYALKQGGTWINYGPLLYHYKDMLEQTSVELSWEQVMEYAQKAKGFVVECKQQRKTTYCHDPQSQYSHIYDCPLTVLRKPKKQ